MAIHEMTEFFLNTKRIVESAVQKFDLWAKNSQNLQYHEDLEGVFYAKLQIAFVEVTRIPAKAFRSRFVMKNISSVKIDNTNRLSCVNINDKSWAYGDRATTKAIADAVSSITLPLPLSESVEPLKKEVVFSNFASIISSFSNNVKLIFK